ncbi:MAG: TolC family protein [Arcobacteraceae bacterium]
MKKITLCLFCFSSLFSNEIETLTETRQEIIKLKQEKIQEKEKVNKYDWVTDINLNADLSNNQDTKENENYSISLSQDIFKFGGITAQIDYAKELKRLEDLDLTISTKEDLNTLYNYILDIKLNEISIKQNILNIKNAQIDIEEKQSEYKAGELSISDLNDAIMTKNNLRETYEILLLTKQKNVNALKQYTNTNYDQIPLPKFTLIEENDYMQNSTAIQYATINKEVTNLSYAMKKSDYLPTLSLNTQYGYKKSEEVEGDEYYEYGLNLTIPLSFTSSNDITQSKLEYLTSKKELEQEFVDQKSFYDEVVMSIKSNQVKIKLANEDIALYNDLLLVNVEEFKAGYKTQDDVTILENSQNIRKLDIETYEVNIQKFLLTLYTKNL